MINDKNLQYLTSEVKHEMIPAENLIELFEKTSDTFPDKVIYYFLEDGFEEKEKINFSEMRQRVKSLASILQTRYKKGDRALMLFPPGIEFIVSLMACIYAGLVGVPAYPPRKNRNFERFGAILKGSDPAFIFTTQKTHEDILKNFTDEPILTSQDFMIYEDMAQDRSGEWKNPVPDPEDPAIFQYTSGSTDAPNGVMLSHRNVLYNSEFIRQAYGHDENSVGVNWLPGFHDMGLIGALFQPVYLGCSNAIIPPNAFLMRPHNWLRSISRLGGTTAGGPNFALDFCAERVKDEDIEGIDLSSLNPFFCGSEPIRKSSIDRFTERFSKYGFRQNDLYPCYGLAEATLIVTGGDLDAKPVYFYADAEDLKRGVVKKTENAEKANILTGCGYPMVGNTVVIVNPETHEPCKKGRVGEIWVSGPSVALGYWDDPDGTDRTFRAYSSEGEGPFMRTGDLGFIEEGQLFISGRLKDLIIIRGLNHYPQDIEQTAEESHEAIQQGSAAAFSVEANEQENLVVVAEIKRTHLRDLDSGKVLESVKKGVAETHGLEPYAIVLARTGGTPKTSSGKIQRFECRNQFLSGSLEEVAAWRREKLRPLISEQEIEKWLVNWISNEMKIPHKEILPAKLITSYGIGSLAAVKMARDAEEEFGIEWPLDLFFEEDLTVKKLTKEALRLLGP